MNLIEKFTKDGPINQFIVDPLGTYLLSLGFASFMKNLEKNWYWYYPYIMTLVQLNSAIFYKLLSKGEENNISRLFRDYVLPPLAAGVIGYIIGKQYGDEWLGLASAFLMVFRELFTDAIFYRLTDRFGYQ